MYSASTLLNSTAETVTQVNRSLMEIDLQLIWDGPARRAAECELGEIVKTLQQATENFYSAAFSARLAESI